MMKTIAVLLLMFYAFSSLAQVNYVNTSFENASPAQWTIDSSTNTITVELIYDHERSSINRANGHWHFQVEAVKGTAVTVILKNFDNIWNRRHASPVMEKTDCLASTDGRTWKIVPTQLTDSNTLTVKLQMESEKIFLASVEPYRISDLDKMIERIGKNKLVTIEQVGTTVEGRPLEIIRIGKNSKKSIVLRARAHPWEAGGNWVVEGLVSALLKKESAKFLDQYTIYIMPMANKDGVARGKTRFNALGVDLNRQWDKEPDSLLAPEKFAFEKKLKQLVASGNKPLLAIDLHNDNNGNIHVNLPTSRNQEYTENMKKFDSLLRRHTWYTEGSSHVVNPGSFGEGLAARYGIDACVYEFNYDWIAGLQKDPTAADWMQLGSKLPLVFYEYVR